jgi:hypothetical protein
MKTLVRKTLLSTLLFATVAVAQAQTPAPAGDATPPAKAKTAQQQKMSDCSKAAAGKKGQEYKDSVSACLKGGAVAPAAPDADKQAACEAAAKSKDGKPLSGAAKTSSVNACLKKAA